MYLRVYIGFSCTQRIGNTRKNSVTFKLGRLKDIDVGSVLRDISRYYMPYYTNVYT